MLFVQGSIYDMSAMSILLCIIVKLANPVNIALLDRMECSIIMVLFSLVSM